jgi:hypothetical protein
MKKEIKYSLLQYRHSIFLQEYLNIGIVMYCKEDRRIEFKFPSSFVRLTHNYSNVSISRLKEILKNYRQLAVKYTDNWKKQGFNLEGYELKDIIEDIFQKENSGVLQFSNIKTSNSLNTQRTFDYLYNEIFKDYFVVKKEHFDERKIESTVANYISNKAPNLKSKFSDIRISNGIIEDHFPYAWKNGKLNIVTPVGLDLEKKDSIKQKAYVTFGRIESFYELSKDKGYNFDIFVSRPQNKDLYRTYDDVLKIIEKTRTSKNIVEQENFNNYLEKAISYLEKH